ncbi:hypothetical protein BD779DRAFT_1667899 [Infundibulicybe gibba]|nr:hypothetical protein BD779DRAFT_1667899 [Infundibulicybe gibba]
MPTRAPLVLTHLAESQMFPSQSQPTAKRKHPEDLSLLMGNSKRSKTESKTGASNKRKLPNAEEQPGGLLIVRAPASSRPPSSQGQPSSSQPNPLTTSSEISQPSRSQSHRPSAAASTSGAGPSGLKKFRASSQPPPSSAKPPRSEGPDQNGVATIHEDLEVEQEVQAMEDEVDHIRRNSRAPTTFDSSDFQFPPRTEPSQKGKARFRDTSQPIPMTESPQIERNKLLREGSMNLIKNGQPPASERTGRDRTREHGHQRRKSSISSRGKRISSSFENTGVITQPHNSVSETTSHLVLFPCFHYLCLSPATGFHINTETAFATPLGKAKEILKNVQDEGDTNGTIKRENEQNVRNRKWEVAYTRHIERAQQEEEAWKKVIFLYDAYKKKALAEEAKRVEQHKSSVAKGKQRATDEECLVREHDLPQDQRRGVALAKAKLASYQSSSASGSTQNSIRVAEEPELDKTLEEKVGELEFNLDRVHMFANAARATTNIAKRHLDHQFALLSTTLKARAYPPPPTPDDMEAGEDRMGAQVLSTYLRPPRPPVSPRDVLRALARVDCERPPAMVGDAARRAAREVQRIGDVGERKLTGIPAVSQTPRKMPGTPRRGSTPGKDKER